MSRVEKTKGIYRVGVQREKRKGELTVRSDDLPNSDKL
jgi:hypothetical protein